MPEKSGTVNVKVYVDNALIANDSVDTNATSKYSIETTGDSPTTSIKVHINEKLYYECTVNFTKEPVVAANEKYYAVSFYVNVVGMASEEAHTKLYEAGYKNIEVFEIPSDEKAGTVIAQSPQASPTSNVDKTAKITLYVAQQPESENSNNA